MSPRARTPVPLDSIDREETGGMTDPVAEPSPGSTRGRGLVAVAAGYPALAAVGLLLGLPALIGELLVSQVIGRVQGAPWTPFGADAEGKTQLSAIILVVFGVPLVCGAVGISRVIRRHLGPGAKTTAIHYLASVVLVFSASLAVRFSVVA